MLQLQNETPLPAERSIQFDRAGNQVWVVVIKATYRLDAGGKLEPHPEPEPVHLSPVWAGEPYKSDLLREAEMVAEHPGTDFSILGSAHAPGGRPVGMVDVSVRAATLSRRLRVFGERVWTRGLVGLHPSEPRPFVTLPIRWERAFGGTIVEPRSGKSHSEERNPIGRGLYLSIQEAEGKPLPNVEDPDDLIRAWNSRPRPAGLGPIPGSWLPRRQWAGTYDENWKRTRLPLLPDDYDPRHTLSAAPGLSATPACHGGETVSLVNLAPTSPLEFRLPRLYVSVDTLIGGSRVRQKINLDRVIIEPDQARLVMVWRSSLNCGKHARLIRKTILAPKPRL